MRLYRCKIISFKKRKRIRKRNVWKCMFLSLNGFKIKYLCFFWVIKFLIGLDVVFVFCFVIIKLKVKKKKLKVFLDFG